MIITWTENDRALLREFNEHNKGRLIEYLKTQLPQITGKTIEETALQSKERQGAEGMIDKLIMLAFSAPSPAPTMEHTDVSEGIV